jgi:hypothetical protein
MLNPVFHACSCASEISFSFAKLAQDPFGFDSAKLVHLLATLEGVGEGTGGPVGPTPWDALAGSLRLNACLLIVPMEAVFGFFETPELRIAAWRAQAYRIANDKIGAMLVDGRVV